MGLLKLALLPITVVMFGVALVAIYDVLRRTHTSNGSKGLWVLFIIIFNILGAFLYFMYGRQDTVINY